MAADSDVVSTFVLPSDFDGSIADFIEAIASLLPGAGYPNVGSRISGPPTFCIGAWNSAGTVFVFVQYTYLNLPSPNNRIYSQTIVAVSQTAASSSETDAISVSIQNMINKLPGPASG